MSDIIVHDDRDTIIAGLREQLRQTREELSAEQNKEAAASSGLANLRKALSPLHQALKQVFGELDALQEAGAVAEVREVGASLKSAAWESWKQRLGGLRAKAIDALQLHGSLTQTQLRIHVGCASATIPDIVYDLNKAGLINKSGGKISLKEL